MNKIARLEEQLNDGVIDELGLFNLWEYYKEKGQQVWQDYIYEKDQKRKALLMKRRDEFEVKNTAFLQLYVEYLIYKEEDGQTENS